MTRVKNKKASHQEKREADKSRTVSGRRDKKIIRLLQDPTVSKEEKNRLMEELYRDIEIKADKQPQKGRRHG